MRNCPARCLLGSARERDGARVGGRCIGELVCICFRVELKVWLRVPLPISLRVNFMEVLAHVHVLVHVQ